MNGDRARDYPRPRRSLGRTVFWTPHPRPLATRALAIPVRRRESPKSRGIQLPVEIMKNWVFPPVAVTGAAAGLTSSSATLNGTVNAEWRDNYLLALTDGTVSGVSPGHQQPKAWRFRANSGGHKHQRVFCLNDLLLPDFPRKTMPARQPGARCAHLATMAENYAPVGSLGINGRGILHHFCRRHLNLSATDSIAGVTVYYVSSSSSPPLAGAPAGLR